jgi:hypothetical protein
MGFFCWGGYGARYVEPQPPRAPGVNQGQHRGITKSNKPPKRKH